MHLFNMLPLLCLITACLTQPLEDAGTYEAANNYGWIGQYSTDDCSTSPVMSKKKWQPPAGNFHIPGPRPDIVPNICTPWYPVLNETAGPSVGVTFGAGAQKTSTIKFFKPVGNCRSDYDPPNGPMSMMPSCCDESQGGFLGAIHEDGVADFGAAHYGMERQGMCTKIGLQPSANQTLWEMRFFVGT